MKELYNLIDKVYFNESKRTTTIKFKNGDISKATASNIAMIDTTYELGITDEYYNVLKNYFDISVICY